MGVTGPGAAESPDGAVVNRKAILLLVMAIAALIYRRPWGWVERGNWLLLAAIVILVLAIPLAIRLAARLRLPGTPFLDAALDRKRPRVRIGAAMAAAIGLAIAASIGAATVDLPAGIPLPLVPHWTPAIVTNFPGAVVVTFLEEAAFRLSLLPIAAALLSKILQRPIDDPSAPILWAANGVQAFAFGAAHVLPKIGLGQLNGIRWYWWLLITPHAWFGGLVQGALFCWFGLETSILEHALFNSLTSAWNQPG